MTTKPPKGPFRASWPESVSRPVVSPLHTSVVYAAQDPDALDQQYEGVTKGYTYAREGHPNSEVLAHLIDQMEGAEGGLVVGSGMAAVTLALLGVLKAGDHAIGADQLYGRSLRLMTEELPRMGIETSFADPTDKATVKAALRPNTRLILIETVSNPTLRVADIAGIIQHAQTVNAKVAVDNTFATPRGFRPFEIGADIVIHSVTKLLAGHSDATLGYVAARDPELGERLAALAATIGTTASPFDCWLAERGLYSFDLRYDRVTKSAEVLADTLAEHPAVKRVFYPTRRDHPDHNRAAKMLAGEGGHMVSFVLKGNRAEANQFVRQAKQLSFAPTLGDIATTISHPASSSHRGMNQDERASIGISEGFFRISVGCEDIDYLKNAFVQALDGLT